MENPIEKFDPSTLMQGVKDRIKICAKCKSEKPLNIRHYSKDSTRSSGYYHTCKQCTSLYHKKHNSKIEIRQKNIDRARIRYNIPEVKKHHKTGNLRGLLCTNCNSGIGHLQDDIKILKIAINYLKKSQWKTK